MKKLSLVLAIAAPLAAVGASTAKADAYWGAPPPDWGHAAAPGWRASPPPYYGRWAAGGYPGWERRDAAPSYRTHFVPGHWDYDHRGGFWVPRRRW